MKSTSDKQINKFSRQLSGIIFNQWSRNIFRRKESLFWINTFKSQIKARKIRNKATSEGTYVPPVAVFSITNKCNLKCRGCYANAQKRDIQKEMTTGRIASLLGEASDCGTRIMIIAGGEPLMRPDVLREAANRKEMLFPVFTNGLFLQNGMSKMFCDNRNLIPILSIEGSKEDTDDRRGTGISEVVENAIDNLKGEQIFFGVSITLTRHNFGEVMSPSFINHYFEKGCRLFFFIEYVPACSDEYDNCLTDKQKVSMSVRMSNLRLVFPSEFIALPGDDEQYGGCLASGRGFIHISSTGNIEPCPFAPFSDVNVNNTSYREALKSDLLKRVRDSHHLLSEAQGGCTLWENREWIDKNIMGKKSADEENKVLSFEDEAA